MNAALRLLPIIVLGYCASVLAAPFFVMAIDTFTALLGHNPLLAGWEEIFGYISLGVTLTGTHAALPFLMSILLLRVLRRYDWPSHGLAGALTAYCALFLAFGDPMQGVQTNLAAVVLGGACAGIVYWHVRRIFGWPTR